MKWDYKKVMEGMSDEELEKRIQEAMDLEFKNKIRPIPYVGKIDEIVEYNTEELIARCPITGYPDIYKLTIRYIPYKLIPELKSLKFYFMEYLELPISHEHIIVKIAKEFDKVVKPKSREFILEAAVRGGITTKITLGKL